MKSSRSTVNTMAKAHKGRNRHSKYKTSYKVKPWCPKIRTCLNLHAFFISKFERTWALNQGCRKINTFTFSNFSGLQASPFRDKKYLYIQQVCYFRPPRPNFLSSQYENTLSRQAIIVMQTIQYGDWNNLSLFRLFFFQLRIWIWDSINPLMEASMIEQLTETRPTKQKF